MFDDVEQTLSTKLANMRCFSSSIDNIVHVGSLRAPQNHPVTENMAICYFKDLPTAFECH